MEGENDSEGEKERERATEVGWDIKEQAKIKGPPEYQRGVTTSFPGIPH